MVNAKAPSSFFDLVQGMKGKSTIGNWDVLVTYDEETLNKRLAEQADASKALEELKVETSVMSGSHLATARYHSPVADLPYVYGRLVPKEANPCALDLEAVVPGSVLWPWR